MYDSFAAVYDTLMSDADYKRRAEYIRGVFLKYGAVPTLLLDLACGTGAFSREFSSADTSVIGVDISAEMLSRAAEKGGDILYICQDMTELDLYGTVDGAICCLDGLNHLRNYDDFCKVLQRTALFLENEKLFIFDINTVYKHKRVLADNTFIKEKGGVYCIWQNEYDKKSRSVTVKLDFFVGEDGTYLKSSETFTETAFKRSAVRRALKKAGFDILEITDGDTYKKPIRKTQRLMYVCKKRGF